ncbi:MAG: hypothetical protein KM310_01810 [Clostridiales bacterium]|nr:hypothetical protein [Clostridiales bacterium]
MKVAMMMPAGGEGLPQTQGKEESFPAADWLAALLLALFEGKAPLPGVRRGWAGEPLPPGLAKVVEAKAFPLAEGAAASPLEAGGEGQVEGAPGLTLPLGADETQGPEARGGRVPSAPKEGPPSFPWQPVTVPARGETGDKPSLDLALPGKGALPILPAPGKERQGQGEEKPLHPPGTITLPVIRGPLLPPEESLSSRSGGKPREKDGLFSGDPAGGGTPPPLVLPQGMRSPSSPGAGNPSVPEAVRPEMHLEEPEVFSSGVVSRGEGHAWRGQVDAGHLGTLEIQVEVRGERVGARLEGHAQALQWLRDAVKELEAGLQHRGLSLAHVEWVPQGGGSSPGSGGFSPSGGMPFHHGGEAFGRGTSGEGFSQPRRQPGRREGQEWQM